MAQGKALYHWRLRLRLMGPSRDPPLLPYQARPFMGPLHPGILPLSDAPPPNEDNL